MGNFETFEELFDGFPPMLSAYQPSFYVDDQFDSVLDDEKQRDRFLVKMMNILMVKRLESSWKSFFLTVEKIRAHHQNALDTIKNYQVAKKNAVVEGAQFSFFEEEEDDFADFIIGKKRQIKIADIDKNGKTEAFKKDLKEDLTALDHLSANLQKFQKQLENEHGETSRDSKLDALLKEINLKRASGDNQQNPKVLIFTVYRDTAEYLFSEMKKRGLTRVAMVSGDVSFVMGSEEKHQNFEPILQRFAPFTKLFKEKEWPKFEPKPEDSAPIQFADWQKWVRQHDAKTAKLLDAPVDILIATDALSEGQNLQDCDFVVNYDIHWNPVRVIQRFGRIDRLGSPNDSIACINFWPTDNINNYLNLQKRIEKRMTLMRLAGAEVPALFSKSFAEMNEGDLLETLQKERMMRQMQVSLDDIEVSEQQFGFDNLSLEKFRQDLNLELKKSDEFYQNMPRGVFSGFIRNPEILPADGLIALLGFPSKKKGNDDSRYPKYEIVFVDFDGKSILINQKEILEQLSQEIKQNPPRELPDGLETADSKVIEKLTGALAKWVKKQAVEEDIQADGSVKDVIGQSIKNKLARLKSGDSKVVEEIKQTDPAENEYQPENCDLIAWLVVHSEAIL